MTQEEIKNEIGFITVEIGEASEEQRSLVEEQYKNRLEELLSLLEGEF